MRFRQIHLDFHTSGKIPGIGSRFDADAFGDAFKRAHVDSVTIFARCHHGYSYHPTRVGTMHPHLDFNLTRAQLDALHARDINAPLYTTAGWDELAAFEHPEWRIVSPEGGSPRAGTDPNGAGWAFLDFSSPYVEHLCLQIDELMQLFPDADGLFIDIAVQPPNVSVFAQAQMEADGLDWTNPEHQTRFSTWALENLFDKTHDAVRRHDANMPLFYNSGHIQRGVRAHYKHYFTHLELESLPTAGWGYDHFPISARYADTLNVPFLGMTGKFHFHWGEVGGYKKPDALLYECAAMLAHGSRCSIGDHLHPTGAIDASSMAVIEPAYSWVEAREAWAVDTHNVAEIGLLSCEAVNNPQLAGVLAYRDRMNEADTGAVRVLLEGQFLFDVLDLESDFNQYRLLILPDVIDVDDVLATRINAYVHKGGQVLLTGRSGVHAEHGFLFDTGARWLSESTNTGGDYVLPEPSLRAESVNDPLFMYRPCQRIELQDGQSLGQVFEPYMNRHARHFSGHVNAPSKPDAEVHVAGSSKSGFTYFAFPIFSCYQQAGAVAMLEIAENLINSALHTQKMVTTTLPRAGRVTLRRQASENRDVLHLLHATPTLRGELNGATIQPIQDLITLHSIELSIEVSNTITHVTLVPDGQELQWSIEHDRLQVIAPKVRGHQMLEIGYKR